MFIETTRRDDADASGALFAGLAVGFLVAAVGRLVIAEFGGVPIQETHMVLCTAWCAALLCASLVLSRKGFIEASLVTKGLFLLVASMPFAPDMLVASIHLGRHVPYRDAMLSSWDTTLGFDWTSYTGWFDRSPVAWNASLWAYDFMFAQIPLTVFALSYARQAARLYTFLAASMMALAICCLVVAFVPALGAYAHAGGIAAGFAHRNFVTGDGMTATLEWLRQERPVGTITELGLISFPSYHAVCAIAGAWALWRVPYLRWPVAVLDAGMLVVTPVQGSHYLVDIVAGAAVAASSLVACSSLVRLAANRTKPLASTPPDKLDGAVTA